ncbi:hypothetical protein B0H10DRAFT_925940 [Mycena sp. CBHHK59/15]|nr:hypothetical protein B0H10DRAFT_925940 [Mycena sp. CBHHK59/15]
MEGEDPSQPSRRPKWLPVTVLAGGTILIAAPLVYLWRLGKPRRIGLNSVAAPPRRVGALSPASSMSSVASRFPLPSPEFPLSNATAKPAPIPQVPDADDDWGVPPPPPDPNDNFNAAFYTFKAFGTATLIVGSIAFGGIWGLRRYLDVDNAEDFGVEMRLAVMDRMPLLASRMHNALQPPSPSEIASERLSEQQLQSEWPWTWDDAQERLSAAFDKGGLGAWADAAAREVEAEAKVEMGKREQIKTTSLNKT